MMQSTRHAHPAQGWAPCGYGTNSTHLDVHGNAIKMCLSAPYCFVNKTGLPMVVRQLGDGDVAAG